MYISKYFAKDLEFKDHKKKAFFKSQNLRQPKETKQLSDKCYENKHNSVIYENTYIRQAPVITQESFGKSIEFEESKVHYRKIKKDKGVEP